MADPIRQTWPIEVTEHLWIEMPDGVRLAARLWRPKCAEPTAALLEYIPYRKADLTRARDERNHPFFAEHGYASLRVDMRGSGDSEGHMPDMYAQNELDDARNVIEWIAEQRWCNGRLGMFGTSWGGTAALQANVNAPEALKAVIAVCATHDRYTDDIHHMGGCVLTDSIEWGATLPAILAAPPTPNVGPHWKEVWRERLENLTCPLEHWLLERGCGAYWRHGSVIHQADQLTAPTLAVGGWSDRYSNSVMTLVDARPDLVWGVIGPWGHHYPDHGHPGPAIGFQALALEWWDVWLQGEEVPDWPRLRVWLRDDEPASAIIDTRAGEWVQSGPALDQVEQTEFHLTDNGLGEAPSGGPWRVPYDLSIGMASGDTGYFGRYGGLPTDQNEDDRKSLVFETAPIAEDLILYGAASVSARVASDLRTGQMALRLNDIAPDGAASRITYAVRNIALDDDLEKSEEPRSSDLHIPFHTVAYRVRAGHRLRLAISSSLWPLVWPVDGDAPTWIVAGSISLPVFRGVPVALERTMPEPVDLPIKKSHDVVAAPLIQRTQAHAADDLISGWHQPWSITAFPDTATELSFQTRVEHRTKRTEAESARTTVDHRMHLQRSDGTAKVNCQISVQKIRARWCLNGVLRVEWNGEVFAMKHWKFEAEP